MFVATVVDGVWTGGGRKVMAVKLKITGPKRTTGRDRSCCGLHAERFHGCYQDIYSGTRMLSLGKNQYFPPILYVEETGSESSLFCAIP